MLIFLCCTSRAEQKILTIIHTSDTHGQISQISKNSIKLGDVINNIRKDAGGEVRCLLIDCGDTTQGTAEAASFQGENIVQVLNELQFDIWVPGNHDFDFGVMRLAENISKFRGHVLAANIQCQELPSLKSWVMLKRFDLNIAVIGLTASQIDNPLWNSSKIQVKQKDAEPSVELAVADAKRHNADIIILAAHHGLYGKDYSLYSLTVKHPEIHIVLGAHTHQSNSGMKLGGTWFAQTASHSENVGRISVVWDVTEKKIVKIYSELIPLKNLVTDSQDIGLVMPDSVEYQSETLSRQTHLRLTEKLAITIAASIADAAKTTSAIYCKKPINFNRGQTYQEMIFQAAPYEETVGTINVTFEDVSVIITELIESGIMKDTNLSCYGIKIIKNTDSGCYTIFKNDGVEWNANPPRLTIAFSSFFLSGAGGKLPRLKAIANDKNNLPINHKILVRTALKNYLEKKENNEP